MSAKSFWPDFDDDWSVEMLAQVMLDMPKRVNLVSDRLVSRRQGSGRPEWRDASD